MPAQLTEQQKDEIAKRLWIQSNPDIAKTYSRDPRTEIANAMLSTGANTAPAVGGWAEGIGRLGSGIAGGLIAKQQRGKYAAAEGNTENALKAAVGPTAASQGAPPQAPAIPPVAPPAPPVSAPVTTPPPEVARLDLNARQAPPPPPPPTVGPGPQAAVAAALGAPPGMPPGAPPGGPPIAPAGTAAMPPAISNPTSPPVPSRGNAIPTTPASTTPPSPVARVATALAPQPAPEVVTGRQAMPAPRAQPAVAEAPVARAAFAPRAERLKATVEGRFGGRDDPYGSYGAVLGYGEYGRPDKPIPDMTIGEVLDFGRNTLIPRSKAAGVGRDQRGVLGSSASGAFQFTGETLRRLAPKVLGDDWQQRTFEPAVQDQLARALFEETKGGNLKKIWASLDDSSPGAYANTPWSKMRGIIMRGESGGTSVGTGAASTEGTDEYGVPVPTYKEVAPLPDAPVMPDRPDRAEEIKSARWEVANRLLGMDTSKLGPGQMGAVQRQIEDLYGKAFDETQEGRMQQDRQEAALTNVAYQNQMSNWSQKDVNRYEAEIGRTTGDEALNRELYKKQYEGNVSAADREDTQAEARETARVLAETNAEAARIEAETKLKDKIEEMRARGLQKEADYYNTPGGAKDFKESMAAQNSGLELAGNADRVLSIAQQMETGGITYASLAGDARAKYDQGVATLGALQNDIVTGKLGGKLGAGVSNADFAALKKATPIAADSPEPVVREFAQKMKMAGTRMADYNKHYLDARGNEGMAVFSDRWSRYMNEAALFDQNGKPVKNYLSYDVWLADAMKSGGVK